MPWVKLVVKPVAAVTDTDAVAVAVPPAPEQVSVYVDVWLRAPVAKEPLVDCEPLQEPLAEQEVVLVDAQVNVLDWPALTDTGLALSETVGAGVVTIGP